MLYPFNYRGLFCFFSPSSQKQNRKSSGRVSGSFWISWRPQQGSNLQRALRRGLLYPFNYEDLTGIILPQVSAPFQVSILYFLQKPNRSLCRKPQKKHRPRHQVYIKPQKIRLGAHLVLFFVQFCKSKLLFLIFFGFCHNFLKKEVAFLFNVYIIGGAKKKTRKNKPLKHKIQGGK